jgi:hypothetical protein
MSIMTGWFIVIYHRRTFTGWTDSLMGCERMHTNEHQSGELNRFTVWVKPCCLTVYIETSMVSYLVAQPSRKPVTAWRQQLTQEWWTKQRGQFACVISQEVIAEALSGRKEQ